MRRSSAPRASLLGSGSINEYHDHLLSDSSSRARQSLLATWTRFIFALLGLFLFASLIFIFAFFVAHDALHQLLVSTTNNYHSLMRPHWNPVFPPVSSVGAPYCHEALNDVNLLRGVLLEDAFEEVRSGLREASIDAISYDTKGRRSRVLKSKAVANAAPALRILHHDNQWLDRLSVAAGRRLYPLDEEQFPMAFTAHFYEKNSFNAPHYDSTRTNSRIHTILLGIESNSASNLVVSGSTCPIPDNAAVSRRYFHIFICSS
jgi:hypothetical protein